MTEEQTQQREMRPESIQLQRARAARNPRQRICQKCGKQGADRWAALQLWDVRALKCIIDKKMYVHSECDDTDTLMHELTADDYANDEA